VNNNKTKKGFLLGASGAPWKEVIQNLSSEYAIEFNYIAGKKEYIDTQSKKIIEHDIIDLYRGIKPAEFKLKEYKVDSLVLNEFLECEQICMEIADRMDQGYSFSRIERERLYIEALEFWLQMIEELSPEFIVITETPHSVYEFVLYSIANKHKIPVLMFSPIATIGRVLPFSDYKNSGSKVLNTYRNYIKNNETPHLKEDLQKYVDSYNQSYDEVIPKYLKDRLNNQSSSPINLKNLINPRHWVNLLRALNGQTQTAPLNYLKMPNEPIESTNGINLKQWKKYKSNAAQYKTRLLKKYNSLCSPLNTSAKYIYIPLQYQPERTSTPEGGRYSNQLLMVKQISNHLPKGWKIIIKENPSQLLPDTLHGERGRHAYFYDDLIDIPHVQLIPIKTSQFKIIDNSEAIATITGTTGFEALFRGKHTLNFGHSWYQGCEGIIKITNSEDCEKAINLIQKNTSIDFEKVKLFLAAFDKHSFKGYLNLKRYSDRNKGISNNLKQLTNSIERFVKEATS